MKLSFGLLFLIALYVFTSPHIYDIAVDSGEFKPVVLIGYGLFFILGFIFVFKATAPMQAKKYRNEKYTLADFKYKGELILTKLFLVSAIFLLTFTIIYNIKMYDAVALTILMTVFVGGLFYTIEETLVAMRRSREVIKNPLYQAFTTLRGLMAAQHIYRYIDSLNDTGELNRYNWELEMYKLFPNDGEDVQNGFYVARKTPIGYSYACTALNGKKVNVMERCDDDALRNIYRQYIVHSDEAPERFSKAEIREVARRHKKIREGYEAALSKEPYYELVKKAIRASLLRHEGHDKRFSFHRSHLSPEARKFAMDGLREETKNWGSI